MKLLGKLEVSREHKPPPRHFQYCWQVKLKNVGKSSHCKEILDKIFGSVIGLTQKSNHLFLVPWSAFPESVFQICWTTHQVISKNVENCLNLHCWQNRKENPWSTSGFISPPKSNRLVLSPCLTYREYAIKFWSPCISFFGGCPCKSYSCRPLWCYHTGPLMYQRENILTFQIMVEHRGRHV